MLSAHFPIIRPRGKRETSGSLDLRGMVWLTPRYAIDAAHQPRHGQFDKLTDHGFNRCGLWCIWFSQSSELRTAFTSENLLRISAAWLPEIVNTFSLFPVPYSLDNLWFLGLVYVQYYLVYY